MDIEQHDQLMAYLRETGRIAADETPEVRTLAGGVSNRTVLVKRPSGEAWVLKQALAKLRVKVDWFSDPARIHREALGLQWLEKLAPPGTITPLVFEDESHHLLAMQAVPEPHENWKTMLLRGEVQDDHVAQFASLLRIIHRASYGANHPLDRIFDDRSFFESLRLEPYYGYTATQIPAVAPFLHNLMTDTRGIRTALVHGDFSPKNILVHNDRLILLDHEVIHWGDPTFDIGFAMTHFLSKALHLPKHRARFISAAMKFCIESDMDELGELAGRHTLACMLARVAGRSPLEYLDDAERELQREIVLEVIASRPGSLIDVLEQFERKLNAC